MMWFFEELKRRNVFRVTAAYAAVAWLVIQVGETLFPVFGVSDDVMRIVVIALTIGLIPTIIAAWVFELTPEGLKLDSTMDQSRPAVPGAMRGFDRAVMILLAIAIAYFAFDKFALSQSREAAIAEAAREAGRSEAVVDAYGDRSIAVLAFNDMSPDGDQEYMSDGIAEEILNLLAKVADLRVISRSSTFAFKGRNLPLPEIASQLNVAYVLEGSVRKAGNQIRITAQLIDAGSDTNRWSETYDRKLENVFDIQDDIAAHVVEALKSTLLDEAPRSQRLDADAYTLVLQARYLWNRRADGDEEQALDLYQKATEIDSSYAPAWTGLSVAYAVAGYDGRLDRGEAFRLAREAVEQALTLDPDSAEARVRLGQAMARDGDYAGSLKEYERAYEAQPNAPLTLGIMAQQAGRAGRINEAVRLYDAAAATDPLGAIWPNNKAGELVRFHRPDEAQAALDVAFALNSNVQSYRERMADIHNVRGEYEQALDMLTQVPEEEYNLVRKAIALHGAGRTNESEQMLDMIKSVPIPEARLGVAQVYAIRGDHDQAFEWLAKVDSIRPWSLTYNPYLRFLVDDPRWKPWVDSLDWPWEYEY